MTELVLSVAPGGKSDIVKLPNYRQPPVAYIDRRAATTDWLFGLWLWHLPLVQLVDAAADQIRTTSHSGGDWVVMWTDVVSKQLQKYKVKDKIAKPKPDLR